MRYYAYVCVYVYIYILNVQFDHMTSYDINIGIVYMITSWHLPTLMYRVRGINVVPQLLKQKCVRYSIVLNL